MGNYLTLPVVLITLLSANLANADQDANIEDSSYSYIHTLTNSSSGNIYSAGDLVTDTVTSSSGNFSGKWMIFNWVRPNNSRSRMGLVHVNLNKYIDFNIPDTEGEWTIKAGEKLEIPNPNNPSKISFYVHSLPEFGKLGLLIPFVLMGSFYIGLRKRIL